MLSLAFESLSFRERVLTTAALVSVLFMVYLSFWYEPLRRTMIEQQQTGLRSGALHVDAQAPTGAAYVELEKALAAADSVSSWLEDTMTKPSFKGLTGFDYLGRVELTASTSSSTRLYAHSFNLKLDASPSQLSVISALLLKHANVEVTKLVWSDDVMDGSGLGAGSDAGSGDATGELLIGVRVFSAQAQAFAISSDQGKEAL